MSQYLTYLTPDHYILHVLAVKYAWLDMINGHDFWVHERY